MSIEGDIFRIDADDGRGMFVAYAASAVWSGYDWGPEESNKVDEDADFNELYGRCSRRGLKFDGLLFDLTLMSNPTLRSNYFGKSRTLP